MAAIAYVDPGNVATNLTAGATSRYGLVWVVVAASLVAILVQYQSAKLGVATGRSLPQLCRERLPVWGNRVLWLQAEVVVLATDLAEFVGAAIGLQLLFGMPAAVSAVPTAAASLLLLELRRKGRTRSFELASAADLSGARPITLFAATAAARTFDYRARDVGYVAPPTATTSRTPATSRRST